MDSLVRKMQNRLLDILDAEIILLGEVILLTSIIYSICLIPSIVLNTIAWFNLGKLGEKAMEKKKNRGDCALWMSKALQ